MKFETIKNSIDFKKGLDFLKGQREIYTIRGIFV